MFDLVQARKDAAERFTTIAIAHVPPGWTVKYRKSLTGICRFNQKLIETPEPKTRKSLYIFLHECAHAHLHGGSKGDGKRSTPRHVEEMEAEQWAHARMREAGVPVPREMTRRAKAYVGWKIKQAVARGAKKIDPRARKFAK